MSGITSYPLRRYLGDQARRVQREYLPLYHSFNFVPVALNADLTDLSNVDPGEPFLWTRITGFAFDSATSTAVIPEAIVSIRRGGTGGKSFMRGPLAWWNLVGWATRPFTLPAPVLIPGGSGFAVTLRQLSGPLTIRYNLVLEGCRVRNWKT